MSSKVPLPCYQIKKAVSINKLHPERPYRILTFTGLPKKLITMVRMPICGFKIMDWDCLNIPVYSIRRVRNTLDNTTSYAAPNYDCQPLYEIWIFRCLLCSMIDTEFDRIAQVFVSSDTSKVLRSKILQLIQKIEHVQISPSIQFSGEI